MRHGHAGLPVQPVVRVCHFQGLQGGLSARDEAGSCTCVGAAGGRGVVACMGLLMGPGSMGTWKGISPVPLQRLLGRVLVGRVSTEGTVGLAAFGGRRRLQPTRLS